MKKGRLTHNARRHAQVISFLIYIISLFKYKNGLKTILKRMGGILWQGICIIQIKE